MDILVITVGDMRLAIPFHNVALSMSFTSSNLKTDTHGTGQLETTLPVVDLRRKLGFRILPGEAEAHVVVIDLGGRLVGLAVNRMSPVYVMQQVTMEPVPGETYPYIKGMTMSQDEPVYLMDWDQLLSTGASMNLNDLFSETASKETLSASSAFIEAFGKLSTKRGNVPLDQLRQMAQTHGVPLSVANRLFTRYALSSEGSS